MNESDTCMTNTTDPAMTMLRTFFARVQIVDLGALLENEAPIWPTHPPLIIHPTITHDRHGYFTNTIFMPEHVGTHCDAPAHADPTQPDFTIDTYPIDAMIGPACIINVADRNLEAGVVLTAADLLAWEATDGEIQTGEIVLINFVWYAGICKIVS